MAPTMENLEDEVRSRLMSPRGRKFLHMIKSDFFMKGLTQSAGEFEDLINEFINSGFGNKVPLETFVTRMKYLLIDEDEHWEMFAMFIPSSPLMDHLFSNLSLI